MIKEPVRKPSVKLEKEESNALIPNVGEGVKEKNENENKPREVSPSEK